MWKMGHKQYMSWNMGRNSEKRGKCEMLTDLEFEEKSEKLGK
ncbi:hypothetical protein T09_10341 [Trichinella sp. T9]|nr:hypothetical protein T09_10341 [Trichinella sp. T9]